MTRKYHWLDHLFNFIAVILGVYLAFYINERAKIKAEKQERRILIQSLINDLSGDISTYEEYQIPLNRQYQANIDTLLASLASNNLAAINTQLPTIFQVENYVPTTSTYSSMKVSGKIRLLDDLTLQKKLTDFYDGQALESNRKGEFQVDYFTNDLLDWFTNNADLTTMEISNDANLTVLNNKIMIYESLLAQKISSYELVVEESKVLKTHLDSLLNVQ